NFNNTPIQMLLPSISVADVKHATRIPLNPDRIVYRVADDIRPRIGTAVVNLGDPPNIVPGFRNMRYSGAACHRSRARVVSRQRQLDVSTVALQQALEMANTGVHVLLRVKWIGHVQLSRSRRH